MRNRELVSGSLPSIGSLIGVQKSSFEWFIDEGIKQAFEDIFPVHDYQGRLQLEYLGHRIGDPIISADEARRRDGTYASPLFVNIRLVNRMTGQIIDSEIFFGEIPIVTPGGTYIIKGTERVVISQMIRTYGLMFTTKTDPKTGRVSYRAEIRPSRGTTVILETSDGVVNLRLNSDKGKKILGSTFLKAFGVDTSEIISNIGTAFALTTDADDVEDATKARMEIYRLLRPTEPPSAEGANLYWKSMFHDFKRYDLSRVGRTILNRKLPDLGEIDTPEGTVVAPSNGLPSDNFLTKEDIMATIGHLLRRYYTKKPGEDIDHLGNKRIKTPGELLQNQFTIGLGRVEKSIRERMSTISNEDPTPSTLINPNLLVGTIREFFSASSQLSQYADQINPIAEIANKRRISAAGPGGLDRTRATIEARDVHYSHYGRICPIETPEGGNIGLIMSLANYVRISDLGFIQTPYVKVNNGVVGDEIVWLTADEEEEKIVVPADTKIVDGHLPDWVIARHGSAVIETEKENVDLIDFSPAQTIGVSASLIPFLAQDDANRALMGCSMQKQAVPLLFPDRPRIGTGIESQIVQNGSIVPMAENDGVVEAVRSDAIVVSGKIYPLRTFSPTNQYTTCIETPRFKVGDKVKKGDALVNGNSTSEGDMALGKNLLVAFMPWEGYNFEDAIVISSRLVTEDVLTSVHIKSYERDIQKTNCGPEVATNDIPNVPRDMLSDLDETGVVRIGAQVRPGSILVGKLRPKPAADASELDRFIGTIFANSKGKKTVNFRNESLTLPHGEYGTVMDTMRFSRKAGDPLPANTLEKVRVFIAQKRKIKVGDKLSGRHGNKGVIAKILPEEDMPYMEDGRRIDIILNPLGVPSRMNIGQLLESTLGLVAEKQDKYYAVPPFAPGVSEMLPSMLEEAGLPSDGKFTLFDGRTGEAIGDKITVGVHYILKLNHMVDDKIHARSTGRYAIITQQPLGGKAQFGGQRFGEMEVWAMEAHGAANNLREMITVKSDDFYGRSAVYRSILNGTAPPLPSVPESFKVLRSELQGLGIKLTTKTTEDE